MKKTASQPQGLEISAERARVIYPPAEWDFSTTAEVEPLMGGVVGQPRAMDAMEFGLRLAHRNYHLYLSGVRGTGKSTYAYEITRKVAQQGATPPDWCYVFDFDHPEEPRALSLPAGLGHLWAMDMDLLVKRLQKELPEAFESVIYEQRRRTLVESMEREVEEIWGKIATMAQLQGFLLQRTPAQIVTIPMDSLGQPMKPAAYAALSDMERSAWRLREHQLEEPIGEGMRQIRQYERKLGEELKKLEEETGKLVFDQALEPLIQKYGAVDGVREHLDRIRADVLRYLDHFRGQSESPANLPVSPEWYLRYHVNLLVDHQSTLGAPVVVESNPTYPNLFGKFEYRGEHGMVSTNFTMIKPGAIHRANGGFLILQIKDLLTAPFAYDTLKRVLLNGEIRMENLSTQLGGMVPVSMRPQSIPVSLKVILIGSPEIFMLLSRSDEDFRRLFKIQVPFDHVMERNPENVRNFVRLVSDYARKEGIRELDGEAMSRLAVFSHRLADDQAKMSTRFGDILAVTIEAEAWAAGESSGIISGRHIQKAVEEKVYRSNLVEARLQEMMENGTLMIRTQGQAVGEVNGLAVLQMGDYAFGKPNRITARTFLGTRGIMHIERENAMSGRLHSKGVLVIAGFVQARFMQTVPLRFGASITFEQLYEEVDGDSASSTELYALLSELSGLAIDQGIAVTGSVNQKGEIQPIGGVNEKIEGFFHLCYRQGLTGGQGVVIPHSNVRNLVLRDEVIESMEQGKFHIWAVHTVDEGIAILTGVKAGETNAAGIFPHDSVNGRVSRRLAEYAERWRKHEGDTMESQSLQ